MRQGAAMAPVATAARFRKPRRVNGAVQGVGADNFD